MATVHSSRAATRRRSGLFYKVAGKVPSVIKTGKRNLPGDDFSSSNLRDFDSKFKLRHYQLFRCLAKREVFREPCLQAKQYAFVS